MTKSLCALCLALLFITSCSEPNGSYRDITNQEWFHQDTLRYIASAQQVNGQQATIMIRHTPDYAYQNLWLKIASQDSTKRAIFNRYEIQLAQPDGQWLGKKSGAIISLNTDINNLSCQSDTCIISIIQNMRSDPLRGIQSVGLSFE